MNYMEQVAEMLGVELEEEFYLKGYCCRYKITNNGMSYFVTSEDRWVLASLWFFHEILLGKLEIIKIPKPILDETEKEYLGNVIKPFRNKIKYIAKYNDDREYISITYKDLNDKTFSMAFPSYDDGTMYKGMELGKRYSLKELGL